MYKRQHLDKENAVVRGGRIRDFVHTLHDGVQGRIITYGKIGAVQIIVNGAEQSYARHIIPLRKDPGSRQGTVSTDNYQCIDVLFLLLRCLRQKKTEPRQSLSKRLIISSRIGISFYRLIYLKNSS